MLFRARFCTLVRRRWIDDNRKAGEVRDTGRITDKDAFETICVGADRDFGLQAGTAREVLLAAIREGRPAVVEGMIKENHPIRTTEAMKQTGTVALFVVGHDSGYGSTYIVHGQFDERLMMPMSADGVAMSLKHMKRAMQGGTYTEVHMLVYHLQRFDPDFHPKCTMPRALQVELMPDEKIGLFAGLRR